MIGEGASGNGEGASGKKSTVKPSVDLNYTKGSNTLPFRLTVKFLVE